MNNHGNPTSSSATPQDPYKARAILFAAIVLTTLPATFALMAALKPAAAVDPLEVAAERLGVDRFSLMQGRETFRTSCATCHGADGQGVPRLGKPLRNSAFVQSSTDDELLALVRDGRSPTDPANTTGMLMPPRGANPTLSDARLTDVVAYLRMMQEPGAPLASTEAWVRPASTPATASAATSAASAAASLANAIGREAFVASCSACHGEMGEGLEGLGKPLAGSAFVQSKTDAELAAFVKQGRPIWDPDNTTGIDMPPKGGNPALSDAQLGEIIQFIRAIQGGSTAGASATPDASAGASEGAAASLASAAGQQAFIASCSACHGQQGEGLEGLGKPLAGSAFVQSKSDAELASFVKQGRPTWDAENTTGLDMPPKGGNPALSDDDLNQIIQFIRSIQPAPGDA